MTMVDESPDEAGMPSICDSSSDLNLRLACGGSGCGSALVLPDGLSASSRVWCVQGGMHSPRAAMKKLRS
jgi:hypothetical protein